MSESARRPFQEQPGLGISPVMPMMPPHSRCLWDASPEQDISLAVIFRDVSDALELLVPPSFSFPRGSQDAQDC